MLRSPEFRKPFGGVVCAAAIGLLGIASLTTAAVADRVERRGQASAIEGTVTRVGEDGVEITTALDARHFVPWDRIRGVQTDRFAAQLTTMMPVAESLWRARSRVERGDTLLAEPLLEQLFERYRGQSHETALVVAEGLLRCRLARGEQAMAVVAAVEAARLRRMGIGTDAYAALPPVLDESTWLCPLLPPLLPEGPALERMRRADFGTDDPIAMAVAATYAAAPTIRRDGSIGDAKTLPPLADRAAADPGVRILDAIVRAAATPTATRSERTAQLLAEADRNPAFVEPWLRALHGIALVADDDPYRVRRGVVQLLHVPALHGRRQPWLAGAALIIAVAAESRDGDPATAAALRRELNASFSYHPLVERPARRAETLEDPS